MKEKIKEFYNKDICRYLIILLVSLILCIPMFNDKLNIYSDDGIQHIARAMGTEVSLKEGSLFGNVIDDFANKFGYSWNLFYGSFTTYGIIFFKLFTGSYITGYKIFMATMLFMSGVTMYMLVNKVTEKKDVALLASTLYLSFPYHLTDLYTRNAVGEFASFVFIPLVFLGLYNLLKTKDKYYYLPIGAIGLIFTHNLTTAIVAFFAFIYLLINIKYLKENYVQKGLVISLFFIIICTACYVFPMIETKLEASYAVYEDGVMATKESFISNGLDIKDLFVTKDGNYSFEIGIHIIIMLAFSKMVFKNINESNHKQEYLYCLIAGLISIFMTTKYFPWKILPDAIAMVQFPWRFMQIGMFFLCIVAAINMSYVIKKFGFMDIVIMNVIAILLVFAVTLIPYNEEKTGLWNYDSMAIMTGKEMECLAGAGKLEYLPTKAYNNKFYIASRVKGVAELDGSVIIEEELKLKDKYVGEVTVTTDAAKIELPYLYYPGYEVRVDGVIKNTFETDNGMLGFILEKDEKANVEVEYIGTKTVKVSAIISFIGFLVLGIYIYKKR